MIAAVDPTPSMRLPCPYGPHLLDTDALVSEVFLGGVPGRILSAWVSQHLIAS